MHTTASQVRSVFSEVHRTQPLHYPMVGPLGNLCWRNIILLAQTANRGLKSYSGAFVNKNFKLNNRIISSSLHLIRRSTPQAVGLIVVESEHLDRSLDA